MKNTIFLIVGILSFSIILYANPQKLKLKYPLTKQDIKEAIIDGARGEGTGLYLRDEASAWSAMSNKGATGFSMQILTPYARIVNSAYEAKRKYMNFTKEDITEEMLMPVVLIIVNPSMPKRLLAADTQFAQSVEHVVLADITRTLIMQPSALEYFDKEAKSGLGAEFTYQGAYVEFPIEDLIKISENDTDKGEFYVKVIGGKSEKEFKIKEKHFDRLK